VNCNSNHTNIALQREDLTIGSAAGKTTILFVVCKAHVAVVARSVSCSESQFTGLSHEVCKHC